MFCARLFICALWSPAGKGLTSWLSFVVSSVSLSLSHWYPGSGVVLDCIDSWSLQPYLLWFKSIILHISIWVLIFCPSTKLEPWLIDLTFCIYVLRNAFDFLSINKVWLWFKSIILHISIWVLITCLSIKQKTWLIDLTFCINMLRNAFLSLISFPSIKLEPWLIDLTFCINMFWIAFDFLSINKTRAMAHSSHRLYQYVQECLWFPFHQQN